ncbi:hypothetical protein [Azotobacter salinestris]|uniref:hypothetical protein n=1 Tax=Azotobacter salinestris TaxID=69964 RepID=UPI001266DE31|nr:hypothetical protein [Azotobacter salinestris]
MPVLFARARLAATILLPAWLLITLLLKLWRPIITGLPEWQVAAIIVPQMIVGMVFVIIPLTQGLLLKLAAKRQGLSAGRDD